MESRNTVGLDRYRLFSGNVHAGQYYAETGSAGIDTQANRDSDKRADFGLGSTDLISAKAQHLLLILVREMWSAIETAG